MICVILVELGKNSAANCSHWQFLLGEHGAPFLNLKGNDHGKTPYTQTHRRGQRS